MLLNFVRAFEAPVFQVLCRRHPLCSECFKFASHLTKSVFHSFHVMVVSFQIPVALIIIIVINPLIVRVVGAPQMILQPVFSTFPCSPLPSGTCQTPVMGEIAGVSTASLGRYLHSMKTRARLAEGSHDELNSHMFDLERDDLHLHLCPRLAMG